MEWQNIHYSADDSYDIALTTDNNGSYVYNGVRLDGDKISFKNVPVFK